MKQTKRKSVNFLRSYFDVLNKLNNDKDKLSFLLSILNKQFLNEDPTNLSMLVDLSYESQRHQLESSVKGWETRTGNKLGNPTLTPTEDPYTDPNSHPSLPPSLTPTEGPYKTSESRYEGSTLPPYGEEEEKEEEEVKEKVQGKVKSIRTVVDNDYNKFVEPNDYIQNLLDKKLTM